jgi:hypothetical protein
MAVNIKSMKVAMGAASAIPPGWNYSAMRDGYDGPNGEYISKMDITVEGSFAKAFAKKYGVMGASNQMASASGANGPAGPYSKHSHGHIAPTSPSDGDMWTDAASGKIYIFSTHNGWLDTAANPFMNAPMATNIPNASISNGNLSVGKGHPYAFHSPPTNVIQIETKVGRVGINTETGDITIPPGIGRDEAIREFWLGFQEHFRPSNTAKYEKEIEGLKRDYVRLETYYKDKLVNLGKDAAKPIIEKVRKKYGSEKFIMVKPEDLIKFIEEA